MIDNLYNPDSMSKEDIKTLFVARQPLLDELVSLVKNQPRGAGVQHVLIIAPRGMGKTTMLLMLQFAIEDSPELSKNWQPIRFPEESYGITELADFWLKVLHYLADATKDETLETKIAELEKRFPKSEDLREAAWASVKDWSKTHKKRIALMVDNFDMILSQINNDTEQARLRDILMNDGTVMLVGCAPSYFRAIQDYGQPLYNFFKVFRLSDLKFADIEELLRRRAEVDEIENIEELLRKNRTRIKALEAFTGGNPRLVLMLYRIITSSDMTEVRKGLERLLDAVTPYYKDKTEKLPPQQRKIIDQIAQYSLEKREGISPTEIAQRIRMTPNQVSSQLKRLAENGYVRSLNIRGRSSFYTLSEPLYAIWSQMRFGRNAREKRNWLVQILKAFYDIQEIQNEIEKLDKRVEKLEVAGQKNKVRGTLEYMLCLLETHPIIIKENFAIAIRAYSELEELEALKLQVTEENLLKLTLSKLAELSNLEIISKENILTVEISRFKNSIRQFKDLIPIILREFELGNFTKALSLINNAQTLLNGADDNLKLLVKFCDDNQMDKPTFYMVGLLDLQKILSEFRDLILKSEKEYNEFEEELVESFSQSKKENQDMKLYIPLLIEIASKNQNFARNVILKSNLEEEFFPLIRAIDYLETKDDDLIEKLSPEVRIVVEETIRTLQMVSEEKAESKPTRKAKNKKDRKSDKSLALSE